MQEQLSQEQLENILNKIDHGLLKSDTTESISVKDYITTNASVYPTVLTIGTFDLLHRGHIDLFMFCKNLAGENGKVVVGVNTDEFVRFYKGKAPIINTTHRMDMVRSIRWVDEVVVNKGDEDCKVIIDQIRPQFLVVGSDWLEKDYLKQTDLSRKYLEDMMITLVYTPRFYDSSSSIKEKIRNEA